jgi:hypothetical protein
MQPRFSTPEAVPPSRWAAVWATLAAVAMGAATGPVAACELFAALALGDGCVPAGVAVGAVAGALIGPTTAPLYRYGSRRRQPAAHRPAVTTSAAAVLIMAAVGAAAWTWINEWAATLGGLDQMPVLLAGLAVAVGGAVLLALASGLLRRRGWARWGAVVGFSMAAVAALFALLAAVRAGVASDVANQDEAGRGPGELVPPIVFLLMSVAVVWLALSPATARDFRASGGQPPPRGAGGGTAP